MSEDGQGTPQHSEMAALVAAFDWATTPLGPFDRWPPALRTVTQTLLRSRHPMFLFWGPELVQIYNDAYRPSLGVGKHPRALGQRGAECWPEIWSIIGPQIDSVMAGRGSTWHEDALVPIHRNGRIEEVYWTYGYSPVVDEQGAIGGTLVVCTETTSRVIDERRRTLIRACHDGAAGAQESIDLVRNVADVLAAFAYDIPCFVAVALGDGGARVLASANVSAQHALVLAQRAVGKTWAEAAPVQLENAVPLQPWPEPVDTAFVTPLWSEGGEQVVGMWGISPRLTFDDGYRDLLAQLVRQLVSDRARIESRRVRRAIELERDNLLMQAPVATAILVGPDHLFHLANDRFLLMVGRETLVGKTYLEAFPELADSAMPKILDDVFRTGRPFATTELEVPLDRTGTGVVEPAWFRFNLEAIRDATGQIQGMLAIAVEITDQVRSRRELERAAAEREVLLAQLQATARAKDEFLAMLSHELRNPLSPIVTALALMKLGDADTAACLPVIERQVGHLVLLVDDLLDVSRFARGEVELAMRPITLLGVIQGAVETASPLIERGRHALAIDVSADLVVAGDAVRLTQVFANLLTNAAKYTPAGGHISVVAEVVGDEIDVRVRDDGVGIEPEMLESVFDMFTQSRQDLARAQGGLGLGLTIVKTLAEKHGGTVRARSEGRGRGSEFVVRLPANRGPAERVPESSPAPADAKRRRLRILIVDDNEDAAILLAEALARVGHEVRCAHDGPTGYQMATSDPPAVALLDIGLPVMDGYELATRLRADPRTAGVQLIAVTGYGQPDDRRRAGVAGFAAHLVKPISFATLTNLIDELGARSAAERT